MKFTNKTIASSTSRIILWIKSGKKDDLTSCKHSILHKPTHHIVVNNEPVMMPTRGVYTNAETTSKAGASPEEEAWDPRSADRLAMLLL